MTDIPDHISQSLETILILKFFDAGPASGNLFDPVSGDGKNFGINIPDPLTLALRPGTARSAIT